MPEDIQQLVASYVSEYFNNHPTMGDHQIVLDRLLDVESELQALNLTVQALRDELHNAQH